MPHRTNGIFILFYWMNISSGAKLGWNSTIVVFYLFYLCELLFNFCICIFFLQLVSEQLSTDQCVFLVFIDIIIAIKNIWKTE